jgi:hypothetical protein
LRSLSFILRTSDRSEEGVWLFDVNDRGDKKVKTKSARRQIPIHPFITNELKLPDYVEALKGEGETRLFPELKKGRVGIDLSHLKLSKFVPK